MWAPNPEWGQASMAWAASSSSQPAATNPASTARRQTASSTAASCRGGVRFAQGGAHILTQRAVGDLAQRAEAVAVVEEERPQSPGDREHDLAMRHPCE